MLDTEVYIDSLNIETIVEAPAYTWLNLLADFGGNSGLYVGFCVLSLFEICELLWDLSSATVRSKLVHSADRGPHPGTTTAC